MFEKIAKMLTRFINRNDMMPTETNVDVIKTTSNLRFYNDEFVFDTVSGMFYLLTPTAGFLLRSLDSGLPLNSLVNQLQKQYNVDKDRAIRDVELFINDLVSLKITHFSDKQYSLAGV